MSNPSSIAATQLMKAAASTNRFQRRLPICLVQTVFNVIVVVKFAGTLHHATAHDTLQQVGVTLLFAALLGSLARMWFLALRSHTR